MKLYIKAIGNSGSQTLVNVDKLNSIELPSKEQIDGHVIAQYQLFKSGDKKGFDPIAIYLTPNKFRELFSEINMKVKLKGTDSFDVFSDTSNPPLITYINAGKLD